MTDDIELRIVCATDGHWGENSPTNDRPDDEPDRDYELTHQDALDLIDDLHSEREVDLVVNNGDIVHDDEELHQEVIDNFFTKLPDGVEWYPTFGNHDWATEDEWEGYYGHGRSHSWEIETEKASFGFLTPRTGLERDSEHGSDANADAEWIEDQIDQFEDDGKDAVFAFQHIPPTDELSHGNDMPDVRDQYARDIVEAIFVGHGHDENTVHIEDGGRYLQSELIGNNRVYVERGVRVLDVREGAL